MARSSAMSTMQKSSGCSENYSDRQGLQIS
jgi:hypothetical protein